MIEAPNRGWTAPRTLAELGIVGVGLSPGSCSGSPPAQPDDRRPGLHPPGVSAASGALALTFFALFGSLFVLTQYLQLVQGYTTLAAGVRALPFAIAMGGRLTAEQRSGSPIRSPRRDPRRTGPHGRWAVVAEHGDRQHGLPPIAIAVVLMGAGMGLIMAPASESIMTACRSTRPGPVAPSTTPSREVSGALGVAVIGSLVSAGFRAHLHLTGLPATAIQAAKTSIAAADEWPPPPGPAPPRSPPPPTSLQHRDELRARIGRCRGTVRSDRRRPGLAHPPPPGPAGARQAARGGRACHCRLGKEKPDPMSQPLQPGRPGAGLDLERLRCPTRQLAPPRQAVGRLSLYRRFFWSCSPWKSAARGRRSSWAPVRGSRWRS